MKRCLIALITVVLSLTTGVGLAGGRAVHGIRLQISLRPAGRQRVLRPVQRRPIRATQTSRSGC